MNPPPQQKNKKIKKKSCKVLNSPQMDFRHRPRHYCHLCWWKCKIRMKLIISIVNMIEGSNISFYRYNYFKYVFEIIIQNICAGNQPSYVLKVFCNSDNSTRPLYFLGITLIAAGIRDYVHYEASDEITFLYWNVNGTTIKVSDWITNFIPHFTRHVMTYPCNDWI